MTEASYPSLCSGNGQYHTDSNNQHGPLIGVSLQQVRLMVNDPVDCKKSEAPWIIPSTLKTRSKQRQLKEGQFYALWADLDNLEGITWSLVTDAVGVITGWSEAYIYSSKSATPENLKCRVLIPLAEPVSGTDFQYGQQVLNDYLSAEGIEPDRATESANQICYLPNRGELYRHHVCEGGAFSLSGWSTETDALKHLEALAEANRKARLAESMEKLRQRLESGQKSPLDAFNAAYSVELVLETYGYRRRGNRWLSPYSESGTPGVVVKDNRWITSHQSDRDAGLEKSGDAFDLLVHFEYGGDFTAAVKAVGEQFTTPDGLTITKHNQREYMRQKSAQDDFMSTEDEGTPEAPLRCIDVSEVMVALPEKPSFAMAPWLPRGYPTLFGGHGGMGKSYVAIVLSAHIASGDTFAGMAVEQGKVLFVSLEDEAAMVKYRLRRVIEEYQLNEFTVLENFELLDGTAEYAALMTTKGDGQNAPTELTAAYEQVREHAEGKTLVVIDNASDAFDANENVRRLVRGFIRSLTTIARENNSAVLLLAHIDKSAARNGSSGNSYSGSTAWHNSSRSRLALIERDGQRVIEHEKLNVGKRANPLPITITDEGVPVPMMQLGAAEDFTEAQDRRDLIAAFRAAGEAGVTVYSKLEAGGYSAMSALANLEEYPERFKSVRKRDVPKLILAMIRDGVIVRKAYTKPNRQRGEKLVLAESQKGEICSDGQTGEEISQSEGAENAA